jgi:signal transduction histidine kinase
MEQVVIQVSKGFGFYSTMVFLAEDDHLVTAANAGEDGQLIDVEAYGNIPLAAEPSLIALSARLRQVVNIGDVDKVPDYLYASASPDTKSELSIPMIQGDQLLGVFDVQSKQTNRFSKDDVRTLTALAEQITIAVRNAQLFAEAKAAREEAERANEVKSSFLASMSHELRTPLNAILNFTGFVADGDLGPVNDEQVEVLNRAGKSGQHLLNLINDILDMAKIEVGMMPLMVQEIDLREVLDSSIAIARGLLQGKPVELEVKIQSQLPIIQGDKRRLRQVFLNILSNAAKFTVEGQIRVYASQIDDNIQIRIEDTGIGIAPEDQHMVFESFQQARHNLDVGGTGLGMPITKYFVEAHHGSIRFESAIGQGTTFFVDLPIETQLV